MSPVWEVAPVELVAMTPLGVLTGYIALGIGLVILSPLIATIALVEWITLWRKGRHPSPFIPEHPDSVAWHHGRPHDARTAWDHEEFKDWADTMEQGRRLQEKEEEE